MQSQFLPTFRSVASDLVTLTARAEIIGVEQFDYSNGAVAGKAGGRFQISETSPRLAKIRPIRQVR